jgi:hypothetical protein
MALDYTLFCDTSATADEIRDLISQAGPSAMHGENGIIRFNTQGLICAITSADKFSQQLTQETFEFIPTRLFCFRLDKFRLHEAGKRAMFQICAAVIRDWAKDCVFQFEDHPLLWRKNGSLMIQKAHSQYQVDTNESWLKPLLDELAEPYTLVDLPQT